MSLHIRKASLQDTENLIDFNMKLAEETERKILNRDILSKGVELMFTDPSKGFYLLAEESRNAVGQLMITYETSDWRNGVFWWIQSVYVKTEWRRKGVFSALYHTIEQQAKEADSCCGIRLYVEEHNEVALETYKKLGLLKTHYFLLEKDFSSKA